MAFQDSIRDTKVITFLEVFMAATLVLLINYRKVQAIQSRARKAYFATP
jgi:hypothetical protein